MKAWLLNGVHDLQIFTDPLVLSEVLTPRPGTREILIRISCCGVCHTELDEIEGRAAPRSYPVIPGHQVIGIVAENGPLAGRFNPGDRVGVAWINSSCGKCEYCLSHQENLCPDFLATGRDKDGGYSEYMVVREDFAYRIPEVFSDVEAAPLLCAGAIGYRSLQLVGIKDGDTLALTGFGASGHLVLKLARHLYPASKCFVFARNKAEQAFAMELGADWAGDTGHSAPEKANAIIDTTPVWSTVTAALLQLKPGGRLVINAIRKESTDQDALLGIRYPDHLWMEKEIKTVANITRNDVEAFLAIAAEIPLKPDVEAYPMAEANEVLLSLKRQNIRGAKVLTW